MTKEKILVLDFGGQYSQLIARRVRELQVYAEIAPCRTVFAEDIRKEGYRGIIFSGGPSSVCDSASPHCDPAILSAGVPILGICYGAQLMAVLLGGTVAKAEAGSEYGKTLVRVSENPLFQNMPSESAVFMSHTDYIERPPEGFSVIARTDRCPCAAMGNDGKKLYGVQFHPEVTHTLCGREILSNFLFSICGCRKEWTKEDYAAESIARLHKKLAGKKVRETGNMLNHKAKQDSGQDLKNQTPAPNAAQEEKKQKRRKMNNKGIAANSGIYAGKMIQQGQKHHKQACNAIDCQDGRAKRITAVQKQQNHCHTQNCHVF